ncbi:hypothetical protein L1887_16992 [Cichorium endivia]|nr:hypothetical protein L1887_16992 [Cichorium endivia]
MFMSIFSSIDAFCAESIGRKLPDTNTNINTQKDSKDGRHNPSTSRDINNSPKLQIRPRFAPELDGVNCFETILPY